ncbi:MAG: hypothetical protein KBD21_02375 [Candidatus Pacebacteria bacterium]|nr:hypothetical protein [Candidatus Paceibacterota bacterium]
MGTILPARRSHIVFDLTDERVSAAVGIIEDQVPHVLWSTEIVYTTLRAQTPLDRCKRLCAAFMEIVSNTAQEGLPALSRSQGDVRHSTVTCVLAYPWSFSNASLASLDFKERKVVEHGSLDRLRAEGYAKLLASDVYQKWSASYGTATIMQQYDQSILLDGYHIPRIHTHEARTAAVHSFTSLTPGDTINKIQSIANGTFSHHRVEFHAATYLFARTEHVQHLDLTDREVLLEIGGNHTSVTLIRGTSILGVSILEKGTCDLFRALVPNAASYKEAESKSMSFGLEGTSLPETATDSLRDWSEQVFGCITALADGVIPPLHVVIAVHEAWFRHYMTALTSRPAPYAAYGGERTVRVFSLYDMEEKDATAKKGRGTSDRRNTILCTAVDKLTRHP